MKDPAVLFYTADFLAGTYTMTDEQVGKYIRLLCIQHQKGTLSEKDMLNICKTYDKDIYSKFIKTDDGYFNQRLRDEAERRRNYAESRRKNRAQSTNNDEDNNEINEGSKKTYDKHMKNICKTYEKHMGTITINETINKNNKKGTDLFLMDYDDLLEELNNSETWLNDTAIANHTSVYKIRLFLKAFTDQQKSASPGKRTLKDFRQHFANWMQKKPPEVKATETIKQPKVDREENLPEIIKLIGKKYKDELDDKDKKEIVKFYKTPKP